MSGEPTITSTDHHPNVCRHIFGNMADFPRPCMTCGRSESEIAAEQLAHTIRPRLHNRASGEFAILRAANAKRQKEWDIGGQMTLSYSGNELAGEIGELCNVLKKIERERFGMPGSRATVDQAAEELADGIICLDLIGAALGIDVWAAVKAKFNKTSEKYGLSTKIEDGRA